MSTGRCCPLCAELKVAQGAAGVQGTGTWRGQIVLLRGGGAVLGRGVGIIQETRADSHCKALGEGWADGKYHNFFIHIIFSTSQMAFLISPPSPPQRR